ncbi:helix-turn-helix domain-containing protein [Krasilnikovia sp. M28-CT-15]|uniref:helix-turn-helix domain-containing protein n=1 Tax=Krasilnikovia sp. M28-CT-15 TaxID=3373540 RepID=UPI0038763DF5
MTQELFSVDEVAERLGLHVRTVRGYVRDGRLKAVRIGRQYRITRADLAALTGGTVPDSRRSAPRHRHADVSATVQIDAVDPELAYRISTLIGAAPVRSQTVHDTERASLKGILLGDLADTAALLRLIDALVTEAGS